MSQFINTLREAFVRMRLLGPVEVDHAGRHLSLTAPRARVVLTLLMLEANHVVSIERLVDAIWDESPPATARTQVQICASTIRRAFEKIGLNDVLMTQAPGYLLRVEPGTLDIHRLDELAKEAVEAVGHGHWNEAEKTYREALDLWDGDAFADVDTRYLEPFRASYAERHLALVEQLNSVRLRRGAASEVISTLQTLVAQHPLREGLRAQLMEAFYLSGRRAEALSVYRQAARVIHEELGLPPDRGMVRLKDSILSGRTAAELTRLTRSSADGQVQTTTRP